MKSCFLPVVRFCQAAFLFFTTTIITVAAMISAQIAAVIGNACTNDSRAWLSNSMMCSLFATAAALPIVLKALLVSPAFPPHLAVSG